MCYLFLSRPISWSLCQGGENLPFAVGYGEIYVNPSVLECSLIDKYGQLDRASLITQRLTIWRAALPGSEPVKSPKKSPSDTPLGK